MTGGGRVGLRAIAALVVTLHFGLHKIANFVGTLPSRLGSTGSWRSARQLMQTYKAGELEQA